MIFYFKSSQEHYDIFNYEISLMHINSEYDLRIIKHNRNKDLN